MYHSDGDLRNRTFQFGRRVSTLFAALPRSRLSQVFGTQLLRAGTSVGANYREAQRARSKAELVSKLGDCLKETDESLYWIEHIQAENLVSSSRLTPLKDEANQLVAIFVALIRNARK